jgi:hypothetical protein
MFRLNGHDFSSRQIISTCILAGNVVLPWTAKNDDVQDEWSWPFLGIHAFSALVLPARHFSSRQIISTCVHAAVRSHVCERATEFEHILINQMNYCEF